MRDRNKTEGKESIEQKIKPFESGGTHTAAPKTWIGAISIVCINEPDGDTEGSA
jgi:hypothetical protein